MEKLTREGAQELIVITENHPGIARPRVDFGEVQRLAKELVVGRWKRPNIVTTPAGVVLSGLEPLHAIVAANRRKVEVEIDRTGKGQRRASTTGAGELTPSQAVAKRGVDDAASKVAVLRAILAGVADHPTDPGPRVLAGMVEGKKFEEAYDAVREVYKTIKTAGSKPTRVRSKVAMAAFVLAYHKAPKKVLALLTTFVSGEAPDGTPVAKLLNAVRTDNINTGSGRRPFMLKAASLIGAALDGEKVERATASEEVGSERVASFAAAFGDHLQL